MVNRAWVGALSSVALLWAVVVCPSTAYAEDRHNPRGVYAGIGTSITGILMNPVYGPGLRGNLHVGLRISELVGIQLSVGELFLIGIPGGEVTSATLANATLRLYVRTSGRWDPYLEAGGMLATARRTEPLTRFRASGFTTGIGQEVHIGNVTIGTRGRYIRLLGVKSSDPDTPVPRRGSLLEGELYVTIRF